MLMTTRRAFLALSLAAPALALAPVGAALAQAPGPIGGIRVDVSRLVEQGWGEHARAIGAGLERELRAAFGGDIRRGGPTLVVSVRQVFLNSYAGNGGGGGRWGGGDGGASSDSFESQASLVGRGNRVLATYPVLSTVPASSAGPWYLPDIDKRRIENLIRHNAGWIKRYVAG
jgi:hypothetical protein